MLLICVVFLAFIETGYSFPTATAREETCAVQTVTLGLAAPSYDRGGGYSTYNCHRCPESGCASQVHMIAMYEPQGTSRGFQQDPSNVPEVPVNVAAGPQSTPLTFVLSTYEAANWVINVPEGVTVAHVFLMSYYLRFSSVKVINSRGEELNNYRLHLPAQPYTRLNYEGTSRSRSTKGIAEITRTMTSEYGCLTSFSGRYVAKSWTLDLSPLNACNSAPTTTATTTTEAPQIEHVDCSTNPCENGARCTEAGAGPFHCFCSWPYYGQRCENENKADICDISTSSVGMATPVSSRNSGYSTHHCEVCPAQSCSSEVHIIAMYEPEGRVRGFQQNPSVIPDVEVNILSSSSHLPLTLVFSSYEATNWVVKIPEGVTVAHVFLMSYYQSYSSVRVQNSNGAVLNNYELHIPSTRTYMDYRGTGPPSPHSFGYGCSSCKGVDYITSTMTSQYGCFASFSGLYVAKSWILDLDNSDCQTGATSFTTTATTTSTEAAVIEHVDCSTNPCENGARCTEAGAGPFHCFCSWPYYGQRCENENKADICDITTDAVAMAAPTSSRNSGYSTHRCEICPTQSCASEVHIIAMYEPEGTNRRGREEPSVIPDVEVDILSSSSHLPLTLVFSSYEATNWIVKLPEGVIVAQVILMSIYQSYSSVRVQNFSGAVLNSYELHIPSTRTYMDHRGTGPPSPYSFGYGCSSCKGVDYITSTMTSQYGCFASFSGRYVAKSWILDLDSSDCQTRVTPTTTATTTSTEAAVIEHVDCSTNPCENGARCTEAGAGPFHCFCSWPYYGQRCENENKADICNITTGTDGMATPNSGHPTHSCEICLSQSCASEVHIIAMYEPEGRVRRGREEPSVIPDVEIDVLSNSSHLPLTLVFSSYEATTWIVKIPEGVSIAHVFLMSYYHSYSSVRVENSNGVELNDYELHTLSSRTFIDHRGTGPPPRPYHTSHGCFSCKSVDYVTSTMTSQYGCFASFSGRYVAKSWTLDLDANNC